MMSSKERSGLDNVMQLITDFHQTMTHTRGLQNKRAEQARHWMQGQFRRELIARAQRKRGVQDLASRIEADLALGRLSPRAAARLLLKKSGMEGYFDGETCTKE